MRRLWQRCLDRCMPRSLTAQLLSLLLGGLLLSHLVGFLVLSQARDLGNVHPMARSKGIDLYLRLFKSVEALDGAAASAALAAASDDKGRFRLVRGPLPADAAAGAPTAEDDADGVDGDSDAEILATLQRQLGRRAAEVRVCVGQACVEPAPAAAAVTNDDATAEALRPRVPMVLQVQRADGQWLEATIWSEMRRRWWWPVSFWLQAGLIPIFLAVAIAVRSVLRPGKALVAAAGKVSRGEKVEPLRVEGPREMREIVLAFNQMQARIGHFHEDRTRMLAAISHDFRTPITSLRLRAELVDDELLRRPMVRTLDEMRCMVDETLDFARDEAQREATVEAPLRGLLDEVIADQQAMGHDVAWADGCAQAELPPSYRCRPVALKRAFANLVDNAVRYGQRASIRLGREDALLCIDIDDEGPGIAPDCLEAAFAPFARLPRGTSAQRSGGSGLGLSIARSCARAHGGDVVLMAREQARGSRARITLPA